jgi:osomolarity two-component system sensor histidine kinase NIK1
MKFLESAGHSTDIVENGALAVEAVKINFYDVTIFPLTRIVPIIY